jgi:pimeloyl-ACP methyl ester carboxylesterase
VHSSNATTLSSNSGINANDTYVIFDMTVNNQATYNATGPLYNPATNTSSTTVNLSEPPTTYHIEMGYDAGGQIVVNAFLTSPAGGEFRLASGGISLFSQSGSPIAIPSFNGAWPAVPQLPPGNPGVISGMAVSDIGSFATATSSAIVAGPTSGSPSLVTVSRNVLSGGGGTTNWTFTSSGSQWVLSQIAFYPQTSNGNASRITNFSNVFFHDNPANDASRASQPRVVQSLPPASTTTIPAETPSTPSSGTTVTVGSGTQNVVFQHGIYSNSSTWNQMIPWLNLDMSLGTEIAPSLPSFNSLSNQSSALVTQIQSQGGSNYILIGHSQGGLISRSAAQYFQSHSPSIVKGVITVDTPNTGALLALNTQVDLSNALQYFTNNLWNDTMCGSPYDNGACFLAYLVFNAIPGAVVYGVDSSLPATIDLIPGSAFLTNLNNQPEKFVRVGIIGDTDNAGVITGKTWIPERLAADFLNGLAGGLPSDPSGGQAFAVYTEVFYDAVSADRIYWIGQAVYDCSGFGDPNSCDSDNAHVDYLSQILKDMDNIESFWNNRIRGPNDTSDGIVQSSSQTYSGATNYPIHGADTHIAATKSLMVRNALDQTLSRQFFVPQKSCNYSLSLSSLTVSPQGTTGSITVETGAGCGWSVVSNVPWLTITSSTTGIGPGTVTFTVAANVSVSRSGSLTIAGQTFVVSQQPGAATWWEAVDYLLQ